MFQQNAFVTFLHKNRWALWLLILLVILLWGYAWVFMKLSLNYMGPFTFSAFRFGVGAVTMLLVIWLSRTGLPPRHQWKHFIVVGILQTTIVYLLIMYGLRFVDAGKSSVLLYSMPMWSSLFAARFLGEKLTPAKLTGLLTGLVGLLTILGWDIWTNQSMDILTGELLIIVGAISWGIANVYYRRNLRDASQLQVNTWQMTFGAIGIIIAAFVTESGEPLVLNVTSISYILFTGVLASALCFTAWFVVLSLIDMVTATISTLLVPVFGLFFSSIILGEHLSTGILIGSGLIIIGIIIAQTSKSRRT
ncbi:DMT family transporter [Barrientosiimonas marina]|uniref:DMT family transporter n=1 Tax=Lentibacillus kimchii TaxID=1542911 RepID=A0ABW2UXS6_9BACI